MTLESSVIHGVKIKWLATHCDDRGWLREVVRDDEDLLKHVGQVTVTKSYPGVIKAFHWHRKQADLWYVASGSVRIVLYDLRANAETSGNTQEIFTGDDNPLALLIPRGVAHGYQVLGGEPALLVYCTSSAYSQGAPDEQRIDFDNEAIGFDWTIRNR